jgi:hypothetical protein
MGMKQIVLILAVVVMVGGCATTSTQFVPSPPGEISAPNNGMSRIIVYDGVTRFMAEDGWWVNLNGKSIGKLGTKGFLYWDTEPGFKTLEVRFDAAGASGSGWKQFHSKSNELIVLKPSYSGTAFSAPTISIQILSGAEKEKLLSELKRRKK